jgi:hypothetical protein
MKISFIFTLACLLLAAVSIARAERPFIVFDPSVPGELKLSDDQKQKLTEKLPGFLNPKSPDYRQRSKAPDAAAHQALWAFLKEMLTAEQFKRFEQLVVQHEPPEVLRPDIAKKLQITGEQRQQIMNLIQDYKKKEFENQQGARPRGIRSTARVDFDEKLEALMSDAQKTQWHEIIGERFDIP